MVALSALLSNTAFAVFLAMFLGVLLGQIEVKGVEFGISGVLFAGLVLGTVGFQAEQAYFTLSLVLFIASVGLLAARSLEDMLLLYGLKFFAIAIAMTITAGAVTVTFLTFAGGNVDPWLIRGTFAGSITSSPSLAAILEITPTNSQESVTTGYSIAYPIGVVVVILFAQFAPQLSDADMDAERHRYSELIGETASSKSDTSVSFSLAGFALSIVLGTLVGLVPIPLGPLGVMTLDITGGTLMAALALGYVGHVGPIDTQMSTTVLTQIREVAIGIFLAVVGIQASASFVGTLPTHGGVLVAAGITTAVTTLLSGYLLAIVFWDLDWICALGTITGGMTSTPGLGAAIHATETEDVGTSYGATYPIALFAKVVVAKILILLL